jgi:hypothetical protein
MPRQFSACRDDVLAQGGATTASRDQAVMPYYHEEDDRPGWAAWLAGPESHLASVGPCEENRKEKKMGYWIERLFGQKMERNEN